MDNKQNLDINKIINDKSIKNLNLKNIDWDEFSEKDLWIYIQKNSSIINIFFNAINQLIYDNSIYPKNFVILVSRLEFNKSYLGYLPNFFCFKGTIISNNSSTINDAPVFIGDNTFNLANVAFGSYPNPHIIGLRGSLVPFFDIIQQQDNIGFYNTFERFFPKYYGELFKSIYNKTNSWTLLDFSGIVNIVPFARIRSLTMQSNNLLYQYPFNAEFVAINEFDLG